MGVFEAVWYYVVFILLVIIHEINTANLFQGPVPEDSFIYHYGKKICFVSKRSVISSAQQLTEKCLVYDVEGDTLLDVRRYGSLLFLADRGNAEIESRRLDCNRVFSVSRGAHQVQGLSVDWSSNTVYWTESTDGTIIAASTRDRQLITAVMSSLDTPTGIALDPIHKHVYLAEAGRNPKIMRSYPDGSEPTVFWDQDIGTPGDLALDLDTAHERLYWVDVAQRSIKSVGLDGTGFKTLLTRPSVIKGITVSEHLISWAEMGSINAFYWANKTDGIIIRPPMVHADETSDIVYFGAYPATDSANGPCTIDNGGCDHICLHTQSDKICRCSFGYNSLDAGRTCVTEPIATGTFLLVADVGWWDAFQIPLDSASSPSAIKLPLGNGEYPVVAQYDHTNHILYWIDTSRTKIRLKKSNIDGGDKTDIYTFPPGSQPQSIAIDTTDQTLYVTDRGRDIIFTISPDGTNYKELVSTGLDQPRDILLDVKSRHMYWTDWGTDSKIERANMGTGLNRVTIVDGVHSPNGITADLEGGFLYWADGELNRIERCKLDGSEKKILAEIPGVHLFGLGLHQDYLYAANGLSRQLKRVHKDTGQAEDWGPSLFQIPFQVKVVTIPPPPTVAPRVTTPEPVSSSLNIPIIAGAAVGGLVVLIIIIVIAVVCSRRRKLKPVQQPRNEFENPGYSSGAIARAPGGAPGQVPSGALGGAPGQATSSISSKKSSQKSSVRTEPTASGNQYEAFVNKNSKKSKKKKSKTSDNKMKPSPQSVSGTTRSNATDITYLSQVSATSNPNQDPQDNNQYETIDEMVNPYLRPYNPPSVSGTVSSRDSDMTAVSMNSTTAFFSKSPYF